MATPEHHGVSQHHHVVQHSHDNNPEGHHIDRPHSGGTVPSTICESSAPKQSDSSGVQSAEHRLYWWVKRLRIEGVVSSLHQGDEHIDIPVNDVVELNGVPQSILLRHIQSEIEEEASFRSLPSALFFVFLFAYVLFSHDKAKVVHDVEEAISSDIWENANFAYSSPGFMGFKAIYDLNSYADFYSWMKVGIVPLMLWHERVWSEDLNADAAIAQSHSWSQTFLERAQEFWGSFDPPVFGPIRSMFEKKYYLRFNRLFGGVVLQQTRAPLEPCSVTSLFPLAIRKDCTFSKRGTSVNLQLEPERFDVLGAQHGRVNRPDPNRTVWLLLSYSNQTIGDILDRMERDQWLDRQTVRMGINFLTYNADFDLLTYTMVNIFQSRSGHFWKRIISESKFMTTFTPLSSVFIADVIFICYISWILFIELGEIAKGSALFCKHGVMRFLQSYLGFWNFVDWMSIIAGYTLMALWTIIAVRTHNFTARIVALDNLWHNESPDPAYIPTIEKDIEEFLDITRFDLIVRHFAAFYQLLIMMRLFKAFSAQPRLALVTRTLSTGMIEILHFGFVFLAIFLTYATMAITLFGRDMEEFTTIERSIDTCFAIMMGEFDVDGMNQVGRAMTMIWFASFMCLLLLVMLNMLLAIIMDTYSEVKGKINSAETLWEQATEMHRRWLLKKRGERVSIHHIWSSFEAHDGLNAIDVEAIVDEEEFMRIVPQLRNVQAGRLLRCSVNAFSNDSETTLTLSQALGVVHQISSKVNRLKKLLRDGDSHTPGQEQSLSFSHSHHAIPSERGQATQQIVSRLHSVSAIPVDAARAAGHARDAARRIAALASSEDIDTLLRSAHMAVISQSQSLQNPVVARVVCPMIEMSTEYWADILVSASETSRSSRRQSIGVSI